MNFTINKTLARSDNKIVLSSNTNDDSESDHQTKNFLTTKKSVYPADDTESSDSSKETFSSSQISSLMQNTRIDGQKLINKIATTGISAYLDPSVFKNLSSQFKK